MQYCRVGNTADRCRLGLSSDTDFARDLEDSKSTSGGISCIFRCRSIVPISWTCNKQTAVSHSSTEPEVISLDAVSAWTVSPLLTNGIQFLIFCTDHQLPPARRNLRFVFSVRNITKIRERWKNTNVGRKVFARDWVDLNAEISLHSDLLYIFENNEAVKKMITKGSSPTIRHVSRTHKVALDLSPDRINVDPSIQVTYPKPTCRHCNQKNIHSWSIETFPPIVQHHWQLSTNDVHSPQEWQKGQGRTNRQGEIRCTRKWSAVRQKETSRSTAFRIGERHFWIQNKGRQENRQKLKVSEHVKYEFSAHEAT